MKYLKLFEKFDWNEDDFDWDEDSPILNDETFIIYKNRLCVKKHKHYGGKCLIPNCWNVDIRDKTLSCYSTWENALKNINWSRKHGINGVKNNILTDENIINKYLNIEKLNYLNNDKNNDKLFHVNF